MPDHLKKEAIVGGLDHSIGLFGVLLDSKVRKAMKAEVSNHRPSDLPIDHKFIILETLRKPRRGQNSSQYLKPFHITNYPDNDLVLSITECISEEANVEPLVIVSEEKVGKAKTKETTKWIVLLKFLIKFYSYGAFNSRHNKLHMIVNKSNWHKLATNAMNGKVTRDVAKTAEVLSITNENPHTFELVLPALLTRLKN